MRNLESDTRKPGHKLNSRQSRVAPSDPIGAVLTLQEACGGKGQRNDLMFCRVNTLGQLDAESDGLALPEIGQTQLADGSWTAKAEDSSLPCSPKQRPAGRAT
ncbi:hypothetical protein N2599_11505 [Rhizobium sullae]|uniref:Uncharacterized protein n=1 Tax=Rhizobium sullae TaxID=50338 RepID=A0ABY5XEB2_RHISU|nr:hypothetical protein [Rhizobium sullae]UWU12802.1 hypothetical protein N2599_11505 [Rhizobium sullae]